MAHKKIFFDLEACENVLHGAPRLNDFDFGPGMTPTASAMLIRKKRANTASVAGVLLLTEATMTKIPEPAAQTSAVEP
jgi:hypothetical protein